MKLSECQFCFEAFKTFKKRGLLLVEVVELDVHDRLFLLDFVGGVFDVAHAHQTEHEVHHHVRPEIVSDFRHAPDAQIENVEGVCVVLLKFPRTVRAGRSILEFGTEDGQDVVVDFDIAGAVEKRQVEPDQEQHRKVVEDGENEIQNNELLLEVGLRDGVDFLDHVQVQVEEAVVQNVDFDDFDQIRWG